MPNIIVTIPAHNEVQSIGEVLAGVHKAVPKAIVLVVCNDCTDGTEQVAIRNKAVTYSTPIHGLANAFRSEMTRALVLKPDIIVHIDADGQYDPAEIPVLVRWVQRGYDLVLGNRLHEKPETKSRVKFALNMLGAFGYSALLRMWIPDMTTGFRAFTPEVAKLPSVACYTYTQEQIWRAAKQGFRIKSVPASFRQREYGESRLINSVRDYLRRSAYDFVRFV